MQIKIEDIHIEYLPPPDRLANMEPDRMPDYVRISHLPTGGSVQVCHGGTLKENYDTALALLELLVEDTVKHETDGGQVMTEEKMKELLFSLAWYDTSAYHHENAKEILSAAYPEVNFTDALEEFVKCKTMPPGEGCPRSSQISRAGFWHRLDLPCYIFFIGGLKMLETNDSPRRAGMDAESHCEVNLGYHVGAMLHIQLRKNWKVKTYRIGGQHGCNRYRVADVNTGKAFNFYPSIHPHEFVEI